MRNQSHVLFSIILAFDVHQLGWGLEKLVDLGVEGSSLCLWAVVLLGSCIYLRNNDLFFLLRGLGKLFLDLGFGRIVVDCHFDSSIRR